jgi:hypothetical protein
LQYRMVQALLGLGTELRLGAIREEEGNFRGTVMSIAT